MNTIDTTPLILQSEALEGLADMLQDLTSYHIPLVVATPNNTDEQREKINKIIDNYRDIEHIVPAIVQLSRLLSTELPKLPLDVVAD